MHRHRYCTCEAPMTIRWSPDGSLARWRCSKRQCRRDVGLCTGTWLEGTQLPLRTAVHFMYWWSYRQTTVEFCARELGMNKNSTVQWNRRMRQVAEDALAACDFIGGPGCTVEVDETLFGNRKSIRRAWLASIGSQ
ncbi:hypothetical protein M514_12506 [Trichuris suis]|nr:hypothetical protein M514_12506 [Trichuris suis]